MRAGVVRIDSGRDRRLGLPRAARAGETLRCVLLAMGAHGFVAADTASGALVRSRAHEPAWEPDSYENATDHSPPSVFDVVDLELALDDQPPDGSRPEAVALARAPVRVGTAKRRALRRLLSDLLPLDPTRALLGSLGPSIAYEDLDGSSPSVSLVAPDRTPALSAGEGSAYCQFVLGGRQHRLSVLDERVVAATAGRRGQLLGAEAVTAAIGGSPRYLVVALGPPVAGQSPKLVLGVLARP